LDGTHTWHHHTSWVWWARLFDNFGDTTGFFWILERYITSPCAKLCHAYRCRDVQSFLISMLGPKRELLGVALCGWSDSTQDYRASGQVFIVYPYGKRVDVTTCCTRGGRKLLGSWTPARSNERHQSDAGPCVNFQPHLDSLVHQCANFNNMPWWSLKSHVTLCSRAPSGPVDLHSSTWWTILVLGQL